MTDPYLLDAITQIQQLKSSYVLGTTTGFAYAYEKSRIIDNFLVATDRPGNYHNRLQRLDMFRGFLEPLEISEQQLRISGLYRYAPPPPAPAPGHPPPYPLPSLLLSAVVYRGGGVPLQPSLIAHQLPLLPPSLSVANTQKQYGPIAPGNSMPGPVARIFLDNFFSPHRKMSLRGGNSQLIFGCRQRGCTLRCRLVSVAGSDPLLYKAEVKLSCARHTNHTAHDDQLSEASLLPLTTEVKVYINSLTKDNPKIKPEAIVRCLTAHEVFAERPFLTNVTRRADSTIKVRTLRKNQSRASRRAFPASSVIDLREFVSARQLVVPVGFRIGLPVRSRNPEQGTNPTRCYLTSPLICPWKQGVQATNSCE
jgi:hypothetical protein